MAFTNRLLQRVGSDCAPPISKKCSKLLIPSIASAIRWRESKKSGGGGHSEFISESQ